ncbi:P-loop NTPase fold protein [Halodesulfovibrio sp. MK-HDV]|uniref:KAP family P-loop NTPase fold protein n=1 Tax=Halodesulfovibrio sp. MK-HDV TaxID=2599925 RepID=UPI00136CFD5F|nr:P-loop NTPase fold protein [Halodesulfovibrio sp. MK-HDV]
MIAPDEGFTLEKDIFGYAKFGEQLEKFYASFDDPLVGVLDAPWGSGKSTFIKMWCGHMRNEGYPVIEFDAFKNDYTDDAFMALAGEVLLLAEELNGDAEEVRKEFVEKATNVIVAAGKGGLKALARKAFTEEGADEIGEALAGAADGAIDSLEAAVKEKLLSRKQEKAAFDSFAEALSTLSEQLGKPEGEGEEGKPLIFVIDELDRCKPTFALALLEKIKHFFSVPNVQFLLVTNLEQLGEVVKCEYGEGINGTAYLQKFYDMYFSLPVALNHGLTSVQESFAGYLLRTCESHVNGDWFVPLAENKNLSFREMLKVHAYAAAMVAGRNSITFGYEVVFIGLACMRLREPDLFAKAIDGALSSDDLESFFIPTDDCMRFYLQAFFVWD